MLYSIILIFWLNFITIPAQTHQIQVIDGDSNEPVSFVDVKAGTQYFLGDIDGIVNLDISMNEKYTFSCVGYEKVDISGAKLLSMNPVKMKMLAIALNPIVVTADKALNLLDQYIKQTYGLILKQPFYLKFFERASLLGGTDTLFTAKSILISGISYIYGISKGAYSETRIQGIDISNEKNIDLERFRKFTNYGSSVNNFLFKEKKSYDKQLFFYVIDQNDSIMIVGYKPREAYKMSESTVLTSGRFYIDKIKNEVIRIDSNIEPKLLQQVAEIESSNTDRYYVVQNFNRKVHLIKGLPSSIFEETSYTLKNDSSGVLYKNIIEINYHLTDKTDFENKPYENLQSESIVYMQPLLIPNFEKEFNQGFKPASVSKQVSQPDEY